MKREYKKKNKKYLSMSKSSENIKERVKKNSPSQALNFTKTFMGKSSKTPKTFWDKQIKLEIGLKHQDRNLVNHTLLISGKLSPRRIT